jgi:hypothetical protein
MLYTGATAGAQQAGVLSAATKHLSEISAFKSSLVPAIAAVEWGLKHALWVAVIVGGVWYWQKGHQIIAARLKAHRLGFNLFR